MKAIQVFGLVISTISASYATAYELDLAKAQEDQAFAVGVQAYVWSYPLVISAATAELVTETDTPKPNGHAPINTFGHVNKLFTAADKDVVSSNVDTVYSSAMLDLKQGAALISVPDTGSRYYALTLEDAYTNIFGYIGVRATGNKAGRYLITGPAWNGTVPADVSKVIKSPTSFVWVIGRTLVKDQADLPNVAAIQQQYTIQMIAPVLDATPMKARWGLTTKPGLVPVEQVDALDWKSYYTWAGQLIKDNPPPQSDSAFFSQFKAIGLTAENGFDVNKLSPEAQKGLERAYVAGRNVLEMEAQKTGGTEANGWAYNLNAGLWGQDYNLRAAIALRSLGQNIAAEALYMNTRQDGDKQRLNGAKKYTITFPKDQTPPVDAFWSITMYNASNFFVDNSINRYAIGNRTEGMRFNADGSLTLYIQKDAPDGDKKANWLPAAEGDFRLSMRLYNPKKVILDGQWTPPAVKVAESN